MCVSCVWRRQGVTHHKKNGDVLSDVRISFSPRDYFPLMAVSSIGGIAAAFERHLQF